MIKTVKTIFVVLLLGSAAPAFADDPPPPPATQAAADKDEGFEKVDGSMQKGESIPADRLVGAAYGFILAAFVGFAVSVALRGRRVEEELDALRRKLEGK